MVGRICTLTVAVSCTAICWIAGFTKPSEGINIFVQMAPWVGGGAWITLTIIAAKNVWKHRKKDTTLGGEQ